jgi:hypothetical protein
MDDYHLVPEKVKMVFAWIDLSSEPMFPHYLKECCDVAGIEDFDVLFGEFIHAGYRLSYHKFIAECNAEGDTFSLPWARGVMDVLGLDDEWKQAFVTALACGSVPGNFYKRNAP